METTGGPITVLSLDVVRKLLTKTGTSQDGTVDLSPPKFALKAHFQDDARMSALSGLRHVSGCSNDKEYFTKKVRRVILSGNDLAQRGDVGGNLMELRVFRQSVECILAENCHLTSLGWHPDKKFAHLVELDLSRNFIQEIPDLSSCPKLHVLNLANNEITKIARLGTNLALMNVDLSGNKIDYDSVQEMKEDMQQGLGALTSLLNLKLEKNPMTFRIEYKDRYRDMVMFSISKCRLIFLDGPVNEEIIQRAKKVEARVVEDPLVAPVKAVVKPKTSRQQPIQQQDLTFPCTLSDLDAMIEECLSTSNEANALLDKLQVEANRIVAAGGGGLFLQEERSHAALITQEFLQKTIALSERRPELRKKILTVLAVLCRVEEEQHFGSACFRQLRVFMGANEETKDQVIAVCNEVIPLHTITDIRLVEEMTDMAEKTGCPELLSRGSALPFVVTQLRSPMLHTPNKSRERETCFHFLAVASRDDASRVRFGQESVGDLLAPEFDKPTSQVRLWVLETVRNLSESGVRNGRKSTNLLFADYVVTPPLRLHTKLLRELDAQRDTDSAMALQIDVLCVLLERSKLAFTDLCASGSNALYEVLSRFFLPKETKHLLTEAATYRLIGSLLTTATQNWCPLVTQTSTRTRKDILDEVQRFVFNGKDVCVLLDFFKQDSLQYSECWSAAKQDEETPTPLFKDLNEPKMHHLLVAIIDLIRAFNTAAQSGLVMAKGVNDRMNARGRETRLFACLEIPNDSVRLAAVRCLDTVKLSQFDSNEIQFLLKLLKEVRDVSSGKTEEVLSVSLGILTKLSRQGGLEFERKFGKTSVEVCLKLLEMNVNRETRGMERESEEKRLLTAACIKLLLQALAKPNVITQQHMLSDAVAAKVNRILVVEDGLFDRKAVATHDPVLVELTSFSVANLTSVFVGVNPNGPVAGRVLRRIANLLTCNRDTIVVDVEQSVERTPQAVQWVALDCQRERDMDSESWSVLAHAMKPTTHEEDAVRIKHHEQFVRSSCLNQILQKLAKTIGKQQLLASGAAGLIPPFSPINPRLGHPNASLQQLLERHLMCERERSNNLDTGGDLRSLTVNLSAEQLAEAQRDLSREQDLDNLEFYETLASSVRVLFACMKFGSPETTHASQQVLRDPQNFLLLINLYFGSRENPQFARYQLGAKLFFLLDAVLDLPPMRRQEQHNSKQVKELDAIVFACADVAMGFLRKRLQSQSRLAPGDEFLVKACMSVCTTVAHQLEYLDVDNTPEEMFRQLVPSSLLSSALQLLLFDMSPKKSLPLAFGGKPVRRDVFGESVEDGAREKTIAFLSYCLRHSPPHRYSILEFLIRSNITDPFPVRRILIQELMKRTHKIGSTQRVALEYLLSDCEQDAVEEDILPSPAHVVVEKEAVAPSSPVEQQHLSWFAWCSGAARKPSSSNESTKPAMEQPNIKTLNVELWDKFSAPPPPTNANSNDMGWIADRLGPRARVVAHSFVMYCNQANACEDKSKTWFYESCLVLTSENYYLFRVNKQDFDFPKRWILLWRRPYRALTRIALGSARIHLAHRASDATTENQVVTLFTPSRVSAKEIASSFYQLSTAWHALLRLDANPPPPVAYIENGHSERFRVANSMSNTLQHQVVTVSNGMMFCDMVRFCIGEKEETWRLGVALIQHETLLFLNKQEWVFEDGDVATPSLVLAAYEMSPKTQILKPLLRVVDFSLNSEPPSPALVLEFGTSSEKKSVAIVFLDDLTRTVWRKYLAERFFKTVS